MNDRTRQVRQPLRAAHGAAILRKHPLALACSSLIFVMGSGVAADVPNAAGASAATATTAAADPQTTPAPLTEAEKKKLESANADKTLETVTVTGIKASIESAISKKENSDLIIEAISAEDLGKLPDVSIAESLARLPGLAAQRTDGHADYISIRGFAADFSGTTFNGREQASTGENRGVEFDQYPAELINSVEVYKTPDATLIGQGLAGTVNLTAVRPLDFKDMQMAVNVRGEHNSDGELNPGQGVGTSGHRVSFSFVDQFLDHTLGVAFGVAQLDSPIQEKQYQAWYWAVNNGPNDGNGGKTPCSNGVVSIQGQGGSPMPGDQPCTMSRQGFQVRAKSESQVRDGLMTVLEWQPTDRYHSELDLFYSKFRQEAYTNGLQSSTSAWDGTDSYADPIIRALGGSNYVVAGTISGAKPIALNDYNNERTYNFSAGWNNRFDFGNQWQAMVDLSYSSARDKLRDAYTFTGVPGGTVNDIQFTTPLQGGYPSLSLPVNFADPGQVGFTDPNNYSYDGREEWDHQKDTIKAIRFEVTHPLGWIFSSFTVGFDYSDRKKTKTADPYFAYLNGNGCSTVYNASIVNPACANAPYNSSYYVPVNSGLIYSPTSLSYAGLPGVLNYNVLAALNNYFYLVPNSGSNDANRNYTVEEKVPLAYVKFNIDTELWGMPLRGNAGVQFVHTKQSSYGPLTNPSGVTTGTVSGGTSYNKALPSINLVGDLGDRKFLRLGLAKEMMRGRIDDEKAPAQASVPDTGPAIWSGSGGNPELKPYVAISEDLSLEKYFGEASYVSAALFHKNVISFIYDQTILNYDFSGFVAGNTGRQAVSNFGPYTTPENGSGGKITGLELTAVLEGNLISTLLDGFGLQSNFSYTRNSMPAQFIAGIPNGPTTFPGLSKKVAGVTIYYEKNGVSVRLAERYRSDFEGEIVANFSQLSYTQILADKQTDFQAGYEFQEGRMKGLSVLFQVINLTNTPYRTQQNSPLPGGIPAPLEYDKFGRTMLLGLNYKL